jgi:hypothetical protein
MKHSGSYTDWVWWVTEPKQAAARQFNAGFTKLKPAKKANKVTTHSAYFA